jgi:hypothetical protein
MADLNQFVVPVPILEKMVHEEEEMRRSEWYIDECNRRKNIPNGWIALTDEGQRRIAKKYFDNDFEFEMGLRQLRSAHHFYPENQIFKNRLQVKYNRARKGELKVGDTVPDSPEFIHPLIKDNMVNMVIGSSMT